MAQQKPEKIDKRAAALRDNLKRRKARVKELKQAEKDQKNDGNGKE